MAGKVKDTDRKRCFVVGPIGDDDSEDRVHADWLLEEIIQPVFEEHFKDYDVKRADKISNPGRIDAQVITELLEAELVIADLTTLNPNAFYEIGIRHTVQKPIIHMHLHGQKIPFDIASFRSIKFETKRPRDLRTARLSLKEAVDAVFAPDYEIDNPVTFSRGKFELNETATPKEKIIQDQLEDVSRRLSMIEKVGITLDPSIARRPFGRPMVHKDLKPSNLDTRGTRILVAGDPTGNEKVSFEILKNIASVFFESYDVEVLSSAGADLVVEVMVSDDILDVSLAGFLRELKKNGFMYNVQ